MTEEELKKGLLALGWRWVYLGGHGDTEALSEKIGDEYFVVGDAEKSNILVPPNCIWDEPVLYNDYY